MKKMKYLWMAAFLFMLLGVAVTGKDSKAAEADRRWREP